MTIRKLIFLTLCCLSAGIFSVRAQHKLSDFGKVSSADLSQTAPDFDATAGAVVIADIGSSEFIAQDSGFVLVFSHFKRVKILNKDGFGAAHVEIPLYTGNGDVEKLEDLKASTYRLENGKIVESSLEVQSVSTDRLNKDWMIKKFTFPALKEGVVIEYSYTLHSNFPERLQSWGFQGNYPCLYSAYEADLPDFYLYDIYEQGGLPFSEHSAFSRYVYYRVSKVRAAFYQNVEDYKWAMKNIASLKEEPFTTNIGNHLARLEFQLASIAFPYTQQVDVIGTWDSFHATLMHSENFGASLDRKNSWLDEDMKFITKDAREPLDKAKKIYAYVRDNFSCSSPDSLYTVQSPQMVFKNRSGSTAEINLLLVTMLNHEALFAYPVILSTRMNGFAREQYPQVNRFNYVIVQLVIDSMTWYLDASERWMGFGHLPERCYNGHARLLDKDKAAPVYFSSDFLTEKNSITVFMSDEGNGILSGSVQSKAGDFASCRFREIIHKKGEPDLFKNIRAGYSGEVELSNLTLDSLTLLDQPLGISYDFRMKYNPGEKLLSFNPMLSEGHKENPFVAAKRQYPVEMPARIDETYTLNMQIPEGYAVATLPKSAKAALPGDEGFFEYLVVNDGKSIQFRSRVRLLKANFKPTEYGDLREFFALIVKKQSEQIVFKKKT